MCAHTVLLLLLPRRSLHCSHMTLFVRYARAAIIQNGTREIRACIDFTEECMLSFDSDGNGEISKPEFCTALATDPVLLATFSTCIITLPMDAMRRVHALREAHPGLCYKALDELWNVYALRRGELAAPMTLSSFRAFMGRHFGTTEAQNIYLDPMFQSLELVHDPVCPLQVMHAIARVVATSPKDSASYFFMVYDADRSGAIDRAEMIRLLLESQVETDQHARRVLRTLAVMDTSGDGLVSEAEFIEQAQRDPVMMAVLERLFGIGRSSLVSQHVTKTTLAREQALLAMGAGKSSASDAVNRMSGSRPRSAAGSRGRSTDRRPKTAGPPRKRASGDGSAAAAATSTIGGGASAGSGGGGRTKRPGSAAPTRGPRTPITVTAPVESSAAADSSTTSQARVGAGRSKRPQSAAPTTRARN